MAASEKTLGVLHEKVATALTEQVEGYEEPIINDEGDVVGQIKVRPSPALLNAAVAFLKNNNITADAAENESLRELNKQLAARRKDKKLPQAALDEAAMRYADMAGGNTIQ